MALRIKNGPESPQSGVVGSEEHVAIRRMAGERHSSVSLEADSRRAGLSGAIAGLRGTMIKSRGWDGLARVVFSLHAQGASRASVCGEWNDWSPAKDIMELIDGRFTLVIELEAGRTYRFRYLLDGDCWENDWAADAYVPNCFGSEDSVVDVTSLPIGEPAPGPTGAAEREDSSSDRYSHGSQKRTPGPGTVMARFRKIEAGTGTGTGTEIGTEAETEAEANQRRMGSTSGGLILWGGTTSFGVSTVVLLALLSRHLHQHGFSGLSTLFGLFFVASLIPSGVPLQAAARVVDGADPPKMGVKFFLVLTAVGAALSPALGYVLHLPVLAMAFLSGQVIVAIPLAIRQGALIAAQRFTALGGNFFIEGGSRVVFGLVGGLIWGMAGLAAGLLLACVVALFFIPVHATTSVATPRPMTSMIHTWFTLVLLGLFVQFDVLIAPSALTRAGATHYDLAAVPSKGVYLVLAAVSTFIFPHVRVHAQRRTVMNATVATLGLGFVVTGVLLLLRGLIAAILGQHVATPFLLLALGAAMSIASATGIIVYGGVALGVSRPWPPLLLGISSLFVIWFLRPTPNVFAMVVLVSQAIVMLMTMWLCLKKRTRVLLHVTA